MTQDTSLPPGCEILIIEDDARLRRRLVAHLEKLGADVSEAGNLVEARNLLRGGSYDFALADVHLPDGEVFDLLREHAFSENTLLVVMTAFGNVELAVEAMRLGASDYLSKPFDPAELPLSFLKCQASRRAKRRDELRAHESGSAQGDLFLGATLAPLHARLDTLLAAEARLKGGLPPVLIEGETGTGKSALARWLHQHGTRAGHPLIAINCAALPDTLLESELFGHERGAFTDAKQAKVGLFEAADGGTLLLDEIGSLSPQAQAKLLTAVEEKHIRRLGGTREIAIDVRIIAASNRPLEQLCAQGHFREDLYHRLRLMYVSLPPLRDWGSDILPLARHLLARLCTKHRLAQMKISAGGEGRLLAQPWRGNIRELSHEIERAVIFATGSQLDFADLGALVTVPASLAEWRNPAWRLPEDGFSLDSVVASMVDEALRETNGNVSAAARRLGVTREFIRYRLNTRQAPESSKGEMEG